MKLDITLCITPDMLRDAQGSQNKALAGHLGTHFDVMDKVFPLDYTCRRGIVFDVGHIEGRDIDIADVPLQLVEQDMFVAFRTAFGETEPYGTVRYFKEHPQLSDALIDALLDKKISIIGVDFAGIRRGKEHIPADQLCADRGVFVIENLRNLGEILAHGASFTAHTYPLNCVGMTGIPCRVIAEV